ncbi:hypothetical protein RI367_008775 [Sorochytrium milnesiophthora]
MPRLLCLLAVSAALLNLAHADPVCVSSVNVKAGDNCWAIANANGLTLSKLQSYNPNIDCNMLQVGQSLCLEAHEANVPFVQCTSKYAVKGGDSCWAIANSNGMSVDQLQGLNPDMDCNALQIGQGVCLADAATTDPPQPTDAPTVCVTPYTVKSGDSCWTISNTNGLALGDFQQMNPGMDCNALSIGQSLCLNLQTVGVPFFACSQTYTVVSGDTCTKIASNNHLSLGDLQQRNPKVDCNMLQVGQRVCLGGQMTSVTALPTTTPAPTTASATVTAPPTQPTNGVPVCVNTKPVQAGSSCYSIGLAYGLTVAQLTALNPGLDCALLQTGAQLCVESHLAGVPFVACSQNYKVASGDTCSVIASRNHMSLNALIAMNNGQLDCNMLQVGQPVCIAGTTTTVQPPATTTAPPAPAASTTPGVSRCGAKNSGATCSWGQCCDFFGYCRVLGDSKCR